MAVEYDERHTSDNDFTAREIQYIQGTIERCSEKRGRPAERVTPDAFRAGTTLGTYEIVALIGAGGMGEVYLARDTKLERKVALKILPAGFAADPLRTQQFIREARAAAALNHPNVAAVYEVDDVEGIHFIAMEFVAGETLKAKITHGPLAPAELYKIATQVVDALEAAHASGIIHRDLKPANIMITPKAQVKLLDFGLAKRFSAPEGHSSSLPTQLLSEDGMVVGTVDYMSPEQALGREVDHRSDIFSLGVVLYEAATGSLPFRAANAIETINRIVNTEPQPVADLNSQVTAALARVVSKCLAKRVQDRYQSAQEVSSDLNRDDAAIPFRFRARNNLPKQLTTFVGREQEIADIRIALSTNRLLTLAAAGGCGKTRLALEVAASVAGEFQHGVWFVGLAPITDPEAIPQAIVAALQMPGAGKTTPLEQLIDYFSVRQLLLVLDNCEHLIAGCAATVEHLLQACSSLRILTTSREALRISGETVWRVPPLLAADAVELFVARARTVSPSVATNEQDTELIAQICSRLDGMPLAIELAASRLKVLTIGHLDSRLEDRFRLLTGGSRTALPRQQTLRATIDWSYNLLSQPEQILFRRLSVFARGWTLEAAESVCAGEDIGEPDVLELLSALLDKSLCERQASELRYGMLETLRQYAEQRLLEEETAIVRRRHATWFTNLVNQATAHFRGPDEDVWLDRLDADHDNLRAALRWNLQNNPDSGLCLATNLWRFWQVRGDPAEARKWLLSMFAAQPEPRSGTDHVKALLALGSSEAATIGMVSAERYFAEALSRSRQSDYLEGAAEALGRLAWAAHERGDYSQAQRLAEESLDIHRQLGNRRGMAESLNTLGLVAHHQGKYPIARSVFTEQLGIHRLSGDTRGISQSLSLLGAVAFRQSDYALARQLFQESLGFARSLHDESSIRSALLNLSRVAEAEGNYEGQWQVYSDFLMWAEQQGEKSKIALARTNLGATMIRLGRLEEGRSLLNGGLDLQREVGNKRLLTFTLAGLAYAAMLQRDFSSARSLTEEGLAISRELGDPAMTAGALAMLGFLTGWEGHYAPAQTLLQQSLQIYDELGNKAGRASALSFLAWLTAMRGEYAESYSLETESLRLSFKLNLREGVAFSLENLASLAAIQGDPHRAVCLSGAADALREAMSCPLPDLFRGEYDKEMTAAHTDLGEEKFAERWERGRSLTLQQAVQYALHEAEE